MDTEELRNQLPTQLQPVIKLSERYSLFVSRFVQGVELAAATGFAILFAIGVVDLALQIVGAMETGAITDPLVVTVTTESLRRLALAPGSDVVASFKATATRGTPFRGGEG